MHTPYLWHDQPTMDAISASISAWLRSLFESPPAGGAAGAAAAGAGDAAAAAIFGVLACACDELPIILAKRACCSALSPSIDR